MKTDKIDFTMQEAQEFISFMRGECDIVRLVNPEDQSVYGNSFEKSEYGDICCRLWGRCERCENCTSLRALQTRGRAYKMEIMNRKTYWVCSRFMLVDGKPYVAEMVCDVSDSMMLDSNRRDEIGNIIKSYNHLLITDPMTGAYNRRFLDEHFLPSLKCCHERGLLVNLAILDIDDFKQVNDVYGHSAGDLLLKDVAGFWGLHFNSRKKDEERLTVRFGGDEFLVITCGEEPEAFAAEIERFYAQMRKICYCNDTQIHFSIAFGLASSADFSGAWSWDELFNLADRRMYENKKKKNSAQ